MQKMSREDAETQRRKEKNEERIKGEATSVCLRDFAVLRDIILSERN
jgi:hypothetical protein